MNILKAWNSYRLMAAFRKTTPEEGLRFCVPLSGDPAMLETWDLRGLKAGLLDSVRAVRLHREQPAALRDEMARWDSDAQDRLDATKASRLGMLVDWVSGPADEPRFNPRVACQLPPFLAKEISFHVRLAGALLHPDAGRKMFLSTFSAATGISRRHIDPGNTLHNHILGRGLKVNFGHAAAVTGAQSFRFVDVAEMDAKGGFTTEEGDITFFKGWRTDKTARGNTSPGVAHGMNGGADSKAMRLSLSAYA